MLTALELKNIRSYKSSLFEFEHGVNIVLGPNASGKTNLLEAIHMVAQGSGFKSTDYDMVRRGAEWARIDANFDGLERTVKIRLQPPEKSFVIDEVPKKRLTDVTVMPVVLFEPNHMLLLAGEPERRRSYIDGVLAQTVVGYRKTLAAYKRVLAQRNSLLKQTEVVSEHLFVWDLRLCELAAVIVEQRCSYLEKMADSLKELYSVVSGTSDVLVVSYESKLAREGYAEAHLKRLRQDFEIDRLRGFTGSGPHRDDVCIELGGAQARNSASRGETRSIVLTLKIAELREVSHTSKHQPLLLLDDVFSELDGRRRRLLAESLKNTQTFVTTTDADAIVKNFMSDYNVITTTN